jgi:hypothetical protein
MFGLCVRCTQQPPTTYQRHCKCQGQHNQQENEHEKTSQEKPDSTSTQAGAGRRATMQPGQCVVCVWWSGRRRSTHNTSPCTRRRGGSRQWQSVRTVQHATPPAPLLCQLAARPLNMRGRPKTAATNSDRPRRVSSPACCQGNSATNPCNQQHARAAHASIHHMPCTLQQCAAGCAD